MTRSRVVHALAVVGLAALLAPGASGRALAQAPPNVPGGYPPPSVEVGPGGFDANPSGTPPWVGETGAPWRMGLATPGWPTPGLGGLPNGVPTPANGGDPFGGAWPAVPKNNFPFATTDPTSGGGAPAAGSDGTAGGAGADSAADPSVDPSVDPGAAGEAAPVRVSLSPAQLMLAEGGRPVAITLHDLDAPLQRVALDLRFDAERMAVTAITVDPMLAMSGAQVDFKHRLEPGRLRLLLALTAADASQLPSGSPGIASVTMAALTAGAAELTLSTGASSVTTSDDVAHGVVVDAAVTVIVNDAPSEAVATEVAVQSAGLVAASAPAGEMGGAGGGGNDVARMARDVAGRLGAAFGGPGGGDTTPLLAWLGVLAAAVLVTGFGYFLGRAPEPAGPRVARGLRRRRRGGVDIEHEVAEEGR